MSGTGPEGWWMQVDGEALRAFPCVAVVATAVPGERLLALRYSIPTAQEAEVPLVPGGWVFGHQVYDAPNGLDPHVRRASAGPGPLRSAWWRPDAVLRINTRRIHLEYGEESPELMAFLSACRHRQARVPTVPPKAIWRRNTSREGYLAQVRAMLHHIQQGNIYEVNLCTERTANIPGMDPFAVHVYLDAAIAAPHAAFLRFGDRYVLCHSPESFFTVHGDQVVSEPMKGTRPRALDPQQDAALVHDLATDPKERAENVMAVDVARHDLSRIAAPGSVQVGELCAVRSFARVHQMVSTVRARIRPGVQVGEVLQVAFPPASMTGAPKARAMELIDAVEDTPRGLFSGSIGYMAPSGAASFNVVIRSLMYDAATGMASLHSGGAITAASIPGSEWEECELKARSVIGTLGHELAD